ncbi:MAG TPA: RHS repeat-associated core domain-containing protein [Saprospiraceae bacterium]|nr:RHS repeat-associated core domain-containing protein [Saprospiraceae bacterium]
MPYGETMVEQKVDGDFSTPYRFTGKEEDVETGLYYYGARYYDPKLSIFMSVDPLADSPANVAWPPYTYTWNNPLKFVDPTGMQGESIDGIENEYVLDTETYEYVQISDVGGDEFDIIHIGSINEDGSISVTGETKIDENVGFDDPQRGNPFNPASGQTATLDGFDDPIFMVLTFGLAGEAKVGAEGIETLGFAAGKNSKYSFGQLRRAVKEAYKKLNVESLPKFKKGKFGSPQRDSGKKGIRLDKEAHPKTTNPNENGPHINWWDWTKGNRGKGGRSDAVPKN